MKHSAVVTVAKAEVKWEFPCFAKNGEGIIWANCPMGKYLSGVGLTGSCAGYSSQNWVKAEWTPLPKAETAGWRVVLDNGGCRLEKPEAPVAEAPKEYPWLGKKGQYVVMFLDGKGHAIAGDCAAWRLFKPGSVIQESEGSTVPCAGTVTITNRPGVEFPRLYDRNGAGNATVMRTAPGTWWQVKDGMLVRDLSDDHWRLEEDPVDVPLPDGSTLTLAFEA